MIPEKIHWYLGYNNLALILEQERRHWLLKTDKNKQIQDLKTGNIHKGHVDNLGSDIILETEKTPFKNMISTITFANPSVDKILDIESSAFTYSATVNGFMFARITSTHFPLIVGSETQHKNFKLKFSNCEKRIIPFGTSTDSPDVYVDIWLRTTTVPTLLMMDDNGVYSIEKTVEFNPNITNTVYYYPLTETIQPINLTDEGSGVYITDMINNDEYIGYPLFWFTCDQTDVGPKLSIANNTTARLTYEQIMFIANEGNASKYDAKLYVGVDGYLTATPDTSMTNNFDIICKCKDGYMFNNDDGDFDIPLEPSSIMLFNNNTSKYFPMGVTCSDNDIINMSKHTEWSYINENTYSIKMDVFDSNCLRISRQPLVSVFDVHFDRSVPFLETTDDFGYAGIRMSSANPSSDIYTQYPHDLNKYDGLPDWMNNIGDEISQHMAIYAIHNTPTSSETNTNNRQVAALLLDPGKMKTDDSDFSNDEIGRVYVISNDDTVYKNNATEENPKPARTVARICDIPTSVMNLSGITGIAPAPVVDKKYVRTEASFGVADKDRLYNTLSNRWVRPTVYDEDGNRITDYAAQNNDYVFNNIDLLNKVDLVNHNEFRELTNLNPMVNPHDVSVALITDGGSGYVVDDTGTIQVGGFAFEYVVQAIGDNGCVTSVDIYPNSDYMINLSNFDMRSGTSGDTEPYGTSPSGDSNGTGLRIIFHIDHYSELIPSRGEIFDDLFALVKERDGLWLYHYMINHNSELTPKPGSWIRRVAVTEYEDSTIIKSEGGLMTSESYMASIIPTIKHMPISKMKNGQNLSRLLTMSTASFVNIIDKTKTPVKLTQTSTEESSSIEHVDMCKFTCSGVEILEARQKNEKSVIEILKQKHRLRYDSYLFWNWEDINDPGNMKFKYGVIRRSFNNILSTDYTTTLPHNELHCDDYVHSNSGTTVVWDVDGVGVMMWVFNPYYQKREIYSIDPETRDIYITKEDLTWEKIDINQTIDGQSISLIDSNGRLAYNILTNNMIQVKDSGLDSNIFNPTPIYQQPEFVQLDNLRAGTLLSDISELNMPMGNWQLVFPRVNSFKLTNLNDGREFTPIKLQTIKGKDLGNIANIENSEGFNINAKSIIIDETDNGVTLKLYNSKTRDWEQV